MARPISTLPDSWTTLATAYGGVQALAKALGVSVMTVRRWATGQPVTGPATLAIAALAKRKRIASPV